VHLDSIAPLSFFLSNLKTFLFSNPTHHKHLEALRPDITDTWIACLWVFSILVFLVISFLYSFSDLSLYRYNRQLLCFLCLHITVNTFSAFLISVPFKHFLVLFSFFSFIDGKFFYIAHAVRTIPIAIVENILHCYCYRSPVYAPY